MIMLSNIIPFILTALIGVAMVTQTAINTSLRDQMGSPIQAALISFFIGTLCLLVIALIDGWQKSTLHYLSVSHLSTIPLWLWLGGFLGVYAISISIYAAPKLGFMVFTGLILLGQVLMSMLLDHFGWLDTEKTPITWQRMLGAVLIAVGILFTLHRQ
ncbi:DMT family transporter [Acinetobacter sp. c2-A9]|uniref:DMT family transporter n=1 Tax=Acinetobacter sp. c2-A9 TaxID=3342802 RepID=UPI0035BACEA2